MKKTLLFACIYTFISCCASAQITYLADTAFTTDVGYGGAPASCMAPHTEYFGWQMGRAWGVWLADAFIIPADSTWVFDTVIVYGYQQGSTTTSPFENCNLQIYDGPPGLGGTVIWGDTSTNVLVNTGFTGMYRVDTVTADGGLTSTDRPIMYLKLHLSPAPVLSTGTYWLSWSAACVSLSVKPASPDKVLPGRINPSGQIARQSSGASWDYIDDSSKQIGMDMIIKAKGGLESVPVVNKSSFGLSQNVPNPFSGSTEIFFKTAQAGYAKLSVYNAIGQLVETLIDGDTNAGAHEITFNAGNLPSGIYYYQLNTSIGMESKKMQIIKGISKNSLFFLIELYA